MGSEMCIRDSYAWIQPAFYVTGSGGAVDTTAISTATKTAPAITVAKVSIIAAVVIPRLTAIHVLSTVVAAPHADIRPCAHVTAACTAADDAESTEHR